MRANIPRDPTPHTAPPTELEGIYLHTMQEISVRLMETLPAGDDLWRTLGQVEALLMEAQFQGRDPQEIFGKGGVAAFCQSILDEYAREGKTGELPAAQDKTVGGTKKVREPRGGINYRRKRRFTAGFIVLASILLCSLAIWYVGLWNYWTGGSSYYLQELHNFEETVTPVSHPSLTAELPLTQKIDMNQVLYTDGVYTLTLSEVGCTEYTKAVKDDRTGKTVYQRINSWYLNIVYTVDSNFRRITYVEPNTKGTATVTLADGMKYTTSVGWLSSGAHEKGYEYVRLVMIELPADVDTAGATVSVDLGVPNLVHLNRISTGRR